MIEGLTFADLPFNAYTLLRVGQQASYGEVTESYRRLLGAQFSATPESGARDESYIRTLWLAYSILGHEKNRAAYDAFLMEAIYGG
jgi:hypothetical protein